MHGSVADSGMKFDSDVVADLCLWRCDFGCAQLQENAKQSQFMTEGVFRYIARWRFSNVRDRYSSKCRMRGSVADPGMKFDSDVVEDLCL